jgi:outer membrane protein assembly factor BamA
MRDICIVATLVLLSACSNTRFLTDDELLYTGRGEIEITPAEPGMNTSQVNSRVRAITDHKMNNGFLGRRLAPPIGLWTYNYWNPEPDRKLATGLKKSLAAPPILISDVNPDLRAQAVENELMNMGYFNARAHATIDTTGRNKRKARVNYHVALTPPFHYRQVGFDTLNEPVDNLIRNSDFLQRIKPGEQFNLGKITDARRELSRDLQNQGYFYFTPELIKLSADTTVAKEKLDLTIGRRTDVPPRIYNIYSIDSIRINISNPARADTVFSDPLHWGDLAFYSTGDYLKPGIIGRSVYIQKGGLYSFDANAQTIKRLNNLGVFNYVRVDYTQSGLDTTGNSLDVTIDATMASNINLFFEVDLVTKSTGYAGPAVMVGITHGNAFRGAEKISVGLNGGFEWQWGKKSSTQLGTLSYEVGINTGLTLPRLLLPGGWQPRKPLFVQQTSVNLDYNLLNRTAYYRMASAMSSLNYRWGINERVQHSFSPFYLNNVRLLNTTPDFDSVVNENIYIRKSFEEQFIIGMRYGFTYDNTFQVKPNNIYFQTSVNTSGNLVDLFNGIGQENGDRPYKLINSIYSQYLKITSDFRYYRNGRNQALVLRFYSGLGLPFRNSTVLPYVEQFFSGGAYSIRGFTARYVGPGSYYEEKSGYIDQSGDIKLEGNIEYRFGISKIVKGAVFLETGNIWLINEDENRPGAKFDFNTFYRELAVGTGIGLRFDFSYFVLRTDFGFPIRNPYMTEGKNWLFGTGEILSGMLFYLAIGYPF